MPANTSADALDSTGKYLVLLVTIGLILALNGAAVAGLVLYCGVSLMIAWLMGCFEPDYVSPVFRLLWWAEDRLVAELSRQIAV